MFKRKKTKTKRRKDPKQKNALFLVWYAFKIFFKQAKWLILGNILLALLVNALPHLESFIGGKLIDQALALVVSGLPLLSKAFLSLLLLQLGLYILMRLLYETQTYLDQRLDFVMPIIHDRLLFGKYLKLDAQLYENNKFIELKSKLDWNFWKIGQTIYWSIFGFGGIFSIIIVATILIQYDYRFIFLMLLSTIPGIILNIIFGKRIWGIWDSQGEDKVKYDNYRSSLYTNDPESFQELKLFSYGPYLLNKALGYNQRFIKSTLQNETKRFRSFIFTNLIEAVLVFAATYLLFSNLYSGDFTVGTFYFVYSLIFSLRTSISYTLSRVTNITTNKNLLQSFYQLMQKEPVIKSGNKIITKGSPVEIKLSNVWFKYPKTKKWIFKNLDLTIKGDEELAIVGKNGAGKTTLLKLIMRVYDPQKGSITINEVDIKEIKLDSYYKQIGFLAQNFNTLSIKVGENIHVGNTAKAYRTSQVKEAAKQAKADKFINEYPKKYNTFLTRSVKGGIKPSGGQWQRIAIARVFYRNPRLIILDEPTSSIDALAEEEIFNNIYQFAKNKTVIIISHRFATVKKAQRIVVVDKGKVVEQGSHQQLLKKKGLYAKMYEKQNK